MIVRFGYVAMSLNLQNASPSKTMTVKQFEKIPNKEAAIKRLERISQENLANTIRLLKYNHWEQIHLYRFSSRLIPLAGHELVSDWDYISPIKGALKEIEEIIKSSKIRVGFHPDHYTLLNSAREHVFEQSIEIIDRHVKLMQLMGINPSYRNVIHVGGKTDGKDKAINRFIKRFPLIPKELGRSLILENDDKTFTTEETLAICEELDLPMVLDLHHDWCNPSEKKAIEMWSRILKSWEKTDLPPKIHISSPKSKNDIRAHADYVDLEHFVPFLKAVKDETTKLDVMIEAKRKDDALFDIMRKIEGIKGIEVLDPSTIQIL